MENYYLETTVVLLEAVQIKSDQVNSERANRTQMKLSMVSWWQQHKISQYYFIQQLFVVLNDLKLPFLQLKHGHTQQFRKVQPHRKHVPCAEVRCGSWGQSVRQIRRTKSQAASCLHSGGERDMSKQRDKVTKSFPTVIGNKQDKMVGTYLG